MGKYNSIFVICIANVAIGDKLHVDDNIYNVLLHVTVAKGNKSHAYDTRIRQWVCR